MKPLRIAIIGAGTAGLATANFLSKQSHQISFFEKAETLAPVGAGLLLQPSGLGVFNKLQVLEEACDLGAIVTGLTGKLPSGNSIVNSFYHEADSAYYGLGIHRATLCHVLERSLKALPITWHMGTDVTQVTQYGNQAVIHYTVSSDKTTKTLNTATFDLVLICNGAKSALRPADWVALDKPYPWGAVWAIVPECDMLQTDILHQFYDGTNIMMGILPTGKIPTHTLKSTQNLSSVFWSLPTNEMRQLDKEKTTQYITNQTAKRWSPIAQWLDTIPSNTQWLEANYRDVVMRQYGYGSIGVLGDAAHAMSPQLGQGANMALLDAFAISEAIAQSHNLKEVWNRYHNARLPSIRFYQRMSRLLTPFYQSHSKSLGVIRNITFNGMYRIPWVRKQMALTVSGVKTGPFSKMN